MHSKYHPPRSPSRCPRLLHRKTSRCVGNWLTRSASRTARLAVDHPGALPTAPDFAHKLHSLQPPVMTGAKSLLQAGSYPDDNYSDAGGPLPGLSCKLKTPARGRRARPFSLSSGERIRTPSFAPPRQRPRRLPTTRNSSSPGVALNILAQRMINHKVIEGFIEVRVTFKLLPPLPGDGQKKVKCLQQLPI